jgi:serine/threonine-protein kinase PknG
MTAQQCTQPGCDGTIEDGYCNVCGMAPAPVPAGAAAAASGGAASRGAASGGPSGPSGPSGSAGHGSVPYGSGGTVGSAGTGSRRGTRGSRGRSSRGIGGGLVEIPPVPARDPATAVLTHPEVPEGRRYCGSCGQPVGRAAGGRPGRAEGFCRNCGTKFSFAPKLEPGEMVHGQYEVLGCLAHGGLGWIYLARDRAVSDMWVVLKGLLNTGDADAQAAALVEREALAEVTHPNIVQIHNFVSHASRADGETAEYIVMEYVGGKSLKEIRAEARDTGGVVPLAHALAYMIEILPAFQYLHDHGLVYCDFKPDNVIQTQEQLKLIDMGGVRRFDSDGAIYGTVGYQAPEIETDGPSPGSDLYTIGRSLAVLTFDFRGYQGEYKVRLPDGVPLLQQQESFTRALRKATHSDPGQRFQTASEMAEQLTGVLREVLATSDGNPRPAFSDVFSPEMRAVGTEFAVSPRGTVFPRGENPPQTPPAHGGPAPHAPRGGAQGPSGFSGQPSGSTPTGPSGHSGQPSGPSSPAGPSVPSGNPGTRVQLPPVSEIVTGLPAPLVDGADPAAGYLATLGGLEPAAAAQALREAVTGDAGVPATVSESVETRLALARALVMAGDPQGQSVLGELAATEPDDWRIAWYNGLLALTAGRAAEARGAFSAVFDELPGELAPKLALAFAAEADGDIAAARRYYQVVWTVDRSYISAAFGLARVAMAGGDRPGAVAALATVPETSSQYAAAQIAAVRLLVSGGDGTSADDLWQADGRLGRLPLDDLRRQQLTVEVLHAALEWVNQAAVPSVTTGAGAAGAAGAGGPGARAQAPGDGRILGCEPNGRALRFGLERGYRALASLTPDPARKVELVDMANDIRPRTWT